MSLYRQLWLAIAALLVLVFGVSLLVTTLSARTYLQEQLSMKNTDNATALALSLSQQGADPVLIELTLTALRVDRTERSRGRRAAAPRG